MKFTEGFWTIKPEMEPLFATEVYDSYQDGDEVVLFAPCGNIWGRGAVLNKPAITVRLSSPMEDVVRVQAVHHDGALEYGPHFQINDEKCNVKIEKTDDHYSLKSGKLQVVAATEAGKWELSFHADGKCLTKTGRHTLAHMTNKLDNQRYMLDSFELSVGECVYGLGERFTAFVKNGQVVDMWNEDGGTSSQISYKNIPFYMTNRGYGIFVNDSGDVSFEVASEKVERVQFSNRGERLDYFVIYGDTPKAILERYTALTGRPALPPAWSFGLWLTTSFTTSYDEETVNSFIDGMKDRELPLHVFHFDCFWMKGFQWCDFEWDNNTFPNPREMLTRLKAKGLKICVWINPYIAQKSIMFSEGKANGYFIKNTDGSVWQWDRWQAGMAIVDFTNPDACTWYQSKLEALMDMGVDCFKTDFGERIPHENVVYHDGSDPVKMHNYYTHLYNKVVFDLLEQKRGVGDAAVFARSATAGGQQFPVHWGGDSTASYISMAETLRAGLSLSLCGFGFWSHDIGGFESTAPADVYKRWCQFGLLSSHSRLHGSTSYRVPWLFDEEACDVLRKFTKLKCSLMPYLYSKAVEAHKDGVPMHRAMFMEFPDDPGCDTLDLQYMLGDSLLVAPIFREDGAVNYYLPRGAWTNYLTGTKVNGGAWIKEHHDYFSLPLMVRENTVLPVGARDDVPDYEYAAGVTLKLYAIADGANIETQLHDIHGAPSVKFTTTRQGNIILVVSDVPVDYTVELYSCEKDVKLG